jgi:cellulose synthase/poly-beta-1,6-N-acetylglucosamine synthase-like glycosyltransferase
MLVLHWVFISGFALYILFTFYFISGVFRLKKFPQVHESLPFVSVIVAARNEENSLRALLEVLSLQDYPNDKIEFIIADDRSADGTWEIIQEKKNQDSRFAGVQITELNPEMTPKKNALRLAIQESKGDIILTTDADCRVPKGWAQSMVNALSSGAGIVVGLSTVDSSNKTFFSRYQFVDFLGIMSANAGVLGWGMGWSGSGQNLGYKRDQFENIDGFKSVAHLVSGDDMYLVQAISNIAPAVFNIDRNSFVNTSPSPTITSFISQRVRWSSNSKPSFSSRPTFFIFLISVFLTNAGLLAGVFSIAEIHWIPMAFGIKFIVEAMVIFSGAHRFGVKVSPLAFVVWNILQPLYIPIMGILGLGSKFKWKS